MRKLLVIAMAICGVANAQGVTSTRVTTFDFQAQDAAGARISDHTRFDTALIACLNNPACVFVQGGRYRITRTTPPPPPPPTDTGTAAITWTAPTQNTDGSALTAVSGYAVYHGIAATQLTDRVVVTGTTYTFTNLPAGTHYFAVATINGAGVEGPASVVGNKVIP